VRWTETWARTNRCDRIELWAFENAIPEYEKYNYGFVDDAWRMLNKNERYKVMQRKILYNLRPDGSETGA
jgi:hypothetical protein